MENDYDVYCMACKQLFLASQIVHKDGNVTEFHEFCPFCDSHEIIQRTWIK